MGFARNILGVAAALTLPVGASAVAAPPEPLVVTQLPDPDPNYVPPPELKGEARSQQEADESIDQAMEGFGRAVGQAALVIRQKTAARCREGMPADVTPEQRFAWEASCRYQRY